MWEWGREGGAALAIHSQGRQVRDMQLEVGMEIWTASCWQKRLSLLLSRHMTNAAEVISDCWALFAVKLTLLTFPVLSLLLFSLRRTIPSVPPGSECRWMRMVILLNRICFSTLWLKEKTIIHKAPVHSRNYTKSPKHSLTHYKSSA